MQERAKPRHSRYASGWPLARLWRAFHVDERASSTMVSFIVGAAFFLVGTTVLLHFVVEPPSSVSRLQEEELKTRATEALTILTGTPGHPVAWHTSASSIDGVERLGLLDGGSSIRFNAHKFDAIARGSYASPSSSNGVIDYPEAKAALALSGYDFHLRGHPVFDAFDLSKYGIEGMLDHDVAYVGNWESAVESEASKRERHALFDLDVGYDNITRTAITGAGDAFRDDDASLKSLLVPLLGSTPIVTSLGAEPACTFRILNASDYQHLFAPAYHATLTRALALAGANGAPCYSEAASVTVNLGPASFEGLAAATLTWNEWVNTSGDASDYGWVEVSATGETWHALTDSPTERSADAPVPHTPENGWRLRTVVITAAECGACMGASSVQVRFRWLADHNTVAANSSWIIDDVRIAPTATTAFHKTFEAPEHDVVVIGSDVDHTLLDHAAVRDAIRGYVNEHGGRLLVLGGAPQLAWLRPLLDQGSYGSSPGVSTPDRTHPLLTVPNELAWQTYWTGAPWSFFGTSYPELFNLVMGSTDEPTLTASKKGAFGSPDEEGLVLLTSFEPHTMQDDQVRKFLANALTYGKYHYLFMELGPEVPTDVPVASITRQGVMDKTRSIEDDAWIEMAIIMYIWSGSPTTAVQAGSVLPSAPTGLLASPQNGQVALQWNAPYPGSATLTHYHVYRGTSFGGATLLATLQASSTTYVDTTALNGVTYYYNVTARSAIGEGGSSSAVSTTPAGTPTVPQAFTATASGGAVQLGWTQPSSNGGAPVTGYKIYRNVTGDLNTHAHYTTIGTSTSWTDVGTTPLTDFSYYVAALNPMGEGTPTAPKTANPGAVPAAPIVSATGAYQQVMLTWAPPPDHGVGIGGYNVYRGVAPGATSFHGWTALPNFTDSPLSDGATFYYRVSTMSADNLSEGPQSLEQQATTITPPGAPTDLLVTRTGPGNLTVSWTPPLNTGTNGITKYAVYAGSSPGALSLVHETPDNTTLTYTELGLGAGTTRYYAVAAKFGTNEGARSAAEAGTTHAVPEAPTLEVTPSPPPGSVLLTIVPGSTDGLTIRYYKVYFSTPAGSEATIVFRNTAPTSPHLQQGLNIGETYKFRVSIVTDAGEGALSPVVESSTSLL